MTTLNSTTENIRRRDFLLKLLAIPAAAVVAIPLLIPGDADAQQRGPGFPGKAGKGKGKVKGGKGKAPGAGGPRGGKGAKGGGKAKGKNPEPSADPAPAN